MSRIKQAIFVMSVIFSCVVAFCPRNVVVEQNTVISGTIPRVSNEPGSSDQSGNEWPMLHASLNHTGTVTTQVSATGAFWSNTSYNVYSSPVVANGCVYVGSYDNNVYCLNATTGVKAWNYTTGNAVYSTPAVAGGYVYVGSDDNKVYCLNATTGTEVWKCTTGDAIFSSPAIAFGRVYVGSEDNNLYCLNALTGTRIWNYTTGAFVDSSPAIAGGCIYVGSEDGYVYCLNATTGGKIWRYLAGEFVDSSPAIAGGCIYVAGVGINEITLYCLPMGIGIPSAPRDLKASQDGQLPNMDLSWQTPANNGGFPITGYNIYRGNASGKETLYWTGGNATTFTDIFVNWGWVYYYKVTAVNALGESAWSIEASGKAIEILGFPVAITVCLLAVAVVALAISTWRKREQ